MRRSSSLLTRLLGAVAGVVLAAAGAVAVAAPAQAATLTQVTGFGSNPGNLAMYAYRPDGLPANAPAVVLLHGCTQNASGYFANSGWQKYADQWKFALIVPQQPPRQQRQLAASTGSRTGTPPAARARRCRSSRWSTTPRQLRRRRPPGLRQRALRRRGDERGHARHLPGRLRRRLDHRRHPVPLRHRRRQPVQLHEPGVDKTPAAWGDLVRGAYSGYTGPRPRVAIWHGTSDTTVAPLNATESRDQWTNVRGVSQTPTSTSSLPGGTSLEVYGNDDVRLYRVSGMGHGTPVDPGSAAEQCGTAARVLPGHHLLDVPRRALLRPERRRHHARPRPRRPLAPPRRRPRPPPRPRRRSAYRQQLRARDRRPRLPVRRLRLRQRLQPADGPLQHLLHQHPQADRPQLLGHRLLIPPTPDAEVAVPRLAVRNL